MFVEFHDLNGNLLTVNFGAILYLTQNPDNKGSIICFNGGTVLEIQESVQDVMLNLKSIAMQNMIKGH